MPGWHLRTNKQLRNETEHLLGNSCLVCLHGTSLWHVCLGELVCNGEPSGLKELARKKANCSKNKQLNSVRLLWHIKTLPGKTQVELPFLKKLPLLASATTLCKCAKYILEVLKVAIRAIGFFRHCEQSASARQHSSCRHPSCKTIVRADA